MNVLIRSAIALSIVLMLLGTACGGGDDTTTSTMTPAAGTPPTATATTPVVSPVASTTRGAEQILFSGTTSGPTTDAGILSVNSDGGDLHRSSPEGTSDAFPGWSPDGQQIAFTRFLTVMDGSVTPNAVIVVTDADGSNERILTGDGVALNPIWSPDGQHIAFERVADPSQPEEQWQVAVSVMNADGSDTLDVGNGTTIVTTPSWSPDGTQIAFGASHGVEDSSRTSSSITIVGVDGTDPHEIIGPDDFGTDMVLSTDWSPDGSKIAFVRFNPLATANSPTSDGEKSIITLWIAGADGSNPRALVGDEFMAAFFSVWSPDSTQLAFVGWEDQFNTGIYTIKADGSDLTNVAEGLTGNVEDGEESVQGSLVMAPSWSPDGDWISFLSVPFDLEQITEPRASAELQMVAADGSEERTIVDQIVVEPVMDPFDSMGSTAPAWRPGHE